MRQGCMPQYKGVTKEHSLTQGIKQRTPLKSIAAYQFEQLWHQPPSTSYELGCEFYKQGCRYALSSNAALSLGRRAFYLPR